MIILLQVLHKCIKVAYAFCFDIVGRTMRALLANFINFLPPRMNSCVPSFSFNHDEREMPKLFVMMETSRPLLSCCVREISIYRLIYESRQQLVGTSRCARLAMIPTGSHISYSATVARNAEIADTLMSGSGTWERS